MRCTLDTALRLQIIDYRNRAQHHNELIRHTTRCIQNVASCAYLCAYMCSECYRHMLCCVCCCVWSCLMCCSCSSPSPTMRLLSLLSTLACISAHVTISPSQVSCSATTLLTLNVPHSCNSNVTTVRIEAQFPTSEDSDTQAHHMPHVHRQQHRHKHGLHVDARHAVSCRVVACTDMHMTHTRYTHDG